MKMNSCTAALRACAVALATGCVAFASAQYQVTFNTTADLQNVFVYADEWNGEVYAWTLFPTPLGSIGAGGPTTFGLGNPNITGWAVLANYGNGAAAGINDSVPPIDGSSFGATFPTYDEPTVASNLSQLYVGGAFNTPQAFYLENFVLNNQDVLKTDLPTGTLHLMGFNGGGAVDLGTATFGPVPEPAGLLALGLGALAVIRRRRR